MKLKNKTIIALFVMSTCFSWIMTACKKLDTEYRNHLEGKEIIYPGIPSNISYRSGYKRLELKWLSSPDPTVSRYVVYYNYNKDSVVFNVPEGKASEFTGGVVNNLNEGTYFFMIYTYDTDNNKSVPVEINNVTVYGDYYKDGLVNRTVVSTDINEDGAVIASFADADATNVSTEVKYTATNGAAKSITLAPSENMVTIADWKTGTPILYRSSYKPVETAIDTFYVQEYDALQVKMDVTSDYLKNYAQPFQSVQTSGRFRDPVDWIVNETVKNHANLGGWGSDESTVLVMESGWGAPDITNGKIYQTTTLPAGTYTLNVELASYGYTGTVRLAAVPGDTLPDYENGQIPGAFASTDLALKTITFDVPQEQQVTIGFLATMTGNQYWRVRKITLLRHY